MTHMAHMDETYLHLVTSLLMEKDTLFRADRSDSMTSEDRDDFLPLVSEFLIPQRDRAFSWDVSFEEGLSGEAIQALIAEQTRTPFYKPLPPSSVTGKFPTNTKSAAIIEEDLQFMTLFSDNMGKKESLPIKKRKFPEKSETSTKKTKAETRNEKSQVDSSINKPTVPSESDFAKPLSKRFEATVPSNNRQQSPSVASTAVGQGKKLTTVVKTEEKQCAKTSASGLHPSTHIYLVPASTSSLSQKVHGVVTTIPPSPISYQHQQQHQQQQMLLPQPSWTDFGVYQSVSADPIRTTQTADSSSSSHGVTQTQSRAPLLASDFGPANGIIIGDGCRVGVYTREERLVRIERFREKKLKRIWRKQIKYDCRKRLADTRPRVKGRFVSRIGENGEELPPEPKPDTESVDSKKKKKKLLKSSPTLPPNAASSTCTSNAPYIAGQSPHTGPNAEGVNSGDTTQESEGDAGEDAGDSICSDGGDSLSMNPRGEGEGELPSRSEEDGGDHDGQTLEDSLGHIIDIICGDDRDEI